jgi:dephospho-CoA kinase
MAAFGQKAYLLADCNGELAAIAGWQVENLVTRVDEFYTSTTAPLEQVAPPLIEAVEHASKELQSEAALVFVPLPLAQAAAQALSGSGFVPQTAGKLGVAAWEEAVKESMPPGTAMLFKKLREDRVLRPV